MGLFTGSHLNPYGVAAEPRPSGGDILLFASLHPDVAKVEDAADAPAAGSPLRYDKALRVRL